MEFNLFVEKYIRHVMTLYVTYKVGLVKEENNKVEFEDTEEEDGFVADDIYECLLCSDEMSSEQIYDHFLYHLRKGDLTKK